MDLEELKTRYPDVFKACVAEGVAKEHERVMAHLRLGEMSGTAPGGLKLAHSAIEAGELMSPAYIAGYVESTRAAADIAARLADDDVVIDATDHAKLPPSKYVDPQAEAVFTKLSALVSRGDGDVAIEDLDEAGR